MSPLFWWHTYIETNFIAANNAKESVLDPSLPVPVSKLFAKVAPFSNKHGILTSTNHLKNGQVTAIAKILNWI